MGNRTKKSFFSKRVVYRGRVVKDKFIEFENKIFSAPYKWLVKKGYIVARKLYLTMDDLYQDILDEYRGNPNWAGDD